ncbi:MAG: hypothetical protein V8R78_07730 [Evtepia gabavorous]
MKKLLALMLSAAFMISLAACGGKNNVAQNNDNDAAKSIENDADTQYYNIGDTVSTDIVDFTLNNCDLSIFADPNTIQPTEKETKFGAKVGSSMIIPTFTVTNKDRSGYIDIRDQAISTDDIDDLSLDWTVLYNDEEYTVTHFDGGTGMDLIPAAVLDPANGDIIKGNDTNNNHLKAGETISLRTIGFINVEPETLNDEFSVTLSLPSSSGTETFTYLVATR